jgi:hypothetical protein
MESKQTNFDEQLAIGQDGEREVAMELLKHGIYTMPLYQFTASMAPVILAMNSKIVCPDLVGFKNGKTFFVESKLKHQWVRYGGVETGINQRHYSQYKALADKTGIPVFIVFVQKAEDPTGMYFTEIHNENTRSWNGYGGSGYVNPPMVFFTSESLKRIQ